MKRLVAVLSLLALPYLAAGDTEPRLATDELRDHETKLGSAFTAYSVALKSGKQIDVAREGVMKALKGWKKKYAEIMERIRKEEATNGLPDRVYAMRVGNYLAVTMAGTSDKDTECFSKDSGIAEDWAFVRTLVEPALRTRYRG